MGLDMHLYKNVYVRHWDHNGDDNFKIEITRKGQKIELGGDITYIKTEVMYWRKANAIHRWFVQNVQKGVDDCNEYSVEIEQLGQLLDVVNQVLNEPSKAGELLPTAAGFFFGDTGYESYYFEDLAATKEILEHILDRDVKDKENKLYNEYSYRSSW
jgi:hypothetical protein